MFKQQDSENVEGVVDTIIGPSVSVEGNFKGEGNIIVEGEVKGSLKTKGYLKASESSNIVANISAGNAELSGAVSGNLKIKDNLDVKESAVITGDIETNTISVAFGAVINGNLKMKVEAVAPENRSARLETEAEDEESGKKKK